MPAKQPKYLHAGPPRDSAVFIDWSEVVAILKGDYDEKAREGLGDYYAILVFGGGARVRIAMTVTLALRKLEEMSTQTSLSERGLL
jgi:hypothetical protein